MLASLEVPAVKDFAELRTTRPGVTGSLQQAGVNVEHPRVEPP